MKVYRYEETDTHWIEIVRPDELFDLSTVDQPGDGRPEPGGSLGSHEWMLKADHILTGRREVYANAYLKAAWSLDRIRRMNERNGNDTWEADAGHLEQVRQLSKT